MANTSRLSLRYPVASDTADVPRDIGNLAADLDKAAIFSKGTFAARPTSTVGSPGIDGRYYFATDTSRLYLDTGTSWVEVASGNDSVTAAMIATDAVDSAEIKASAVGSDEIASKAVTTAKFAFKSLLLGETTTTSTQSSSSAESNGLFTNLSCDIPANSYYKAVATWSALTSSVAGDIANLRIYEDSSFKTNELNYCQINGGAGSVSYVGSTTSAATIVFNFKIIRSGGTGTCTIGGFSGRPARLWVEYLGPTS